MELNQIKKIKKMIDAQFTIERNKDRGLLTSVVGDCLTQLEIEIQKNLKAFENEQTTD